MDKVWRGFLLGYLFSAVLMVPIGYLIFQIFPLLGYDDPKEALKEVLPGGCKFSYTPTDGFARGEVAFPLEKLFDYTRSILSRSAPPAVPGRERPVA